MKRILSVLLLFALLMLCVSCSSNKPLSRMVTAFDETCTISLYLEKKNATLDEAEAALTQYEQTLMQELEKLNSANGEEIAVSEAFLDMLKTAQEFTIETDGAFDITSGALSTLWQTAKDRGTPPTETEWAAAKFNVGGHQLVLSDDTALLKPGATLDLSGMVYGAAADSLTPVVKKTCGSALIECGEVTVVIGNMPDGDPFHLDLADPTNPDNTVGTIGVSDCAVATANAMRGSFDINGKTYSSILDPKTGYPVDSGLLAVTVVAPNATLAQMLARAFLVMGYDKASAVLAQYEGVEAVFVTEKLAVVSTSGIMRIK